MGTVHFACVGEYLTTVAHRSGVFSGSVEDLSTALLAHAQLLVLPLCAVRATSAGYIQYILTTFFCSYAAGVATHTVGGLMLEWAGDGECGTLGLATNAALATEGLLVIFRGR